MNEMLFLEIQFDQLKLAYGSIANTMIYQVFIALVVFDIITGTLKGFINKEANSTKGLLGLVKHLLILLMVLIVTPYLVMLELQWLASAFIVFFIAQYGISAVENWVQIGLPMPEYVKQFFEKLQRESNEIDISKVKITLDEPKKEDNI